jgi:hypothetical protein
MDIRAHTYRNRLSCPLFIFNQALGGCYWIVRVSHMFWTDKWFMCIFSHSASCLFNFVDCFLCCAEGLVWWRPTYLFFLLLLSFWCYTQEIIAKKIVRRCPLCFLLEVLNFKYYVQLLCYVMLCITYSGGPISFYCIWISSFPNTICWKDYPFSIMYSWHPHPTWDD